MATWILALMLLGTFANAAGRVQWKSTKINELSDGKGWRVELTIFLPRAPDTAHMPMKFEFEPLVYYERAMVDGDKLVERSVPLTGRQALIESVDVGFLDPGTGKIENRTKFSFKVTRAHGYDAGEYKVTIRDARNGQIVGTATKLIFAGENEIIDRRAIVFTGGEGKKKKKKPADDAEGEEGDKAGSEQSEEEAAAAKAEEGSMAGDDPSPDDEAPSDELEENKEKPGGCGCRVTAPSPTGLGALLAALVIGLAFVRRLR
jgi:MYXO-CTERM domain-containing protein